MTDLLLVISGVVSAFGTGLVGWLFGRRKTRAEAVSAEIDNDIKLSNHYRDILDDLKRKYEERYQEYEQMMNRKVVLLEEEIKLKDRKIKLQQQEINELRKENRVLKTKNANSCPT